MHLINLSGHDFCKDENKLELEICENTFSLLKFVLKMTTKNFHKYADGFHQSLTQTSFRKLTWKIY